MNLFTQFAMMSPWSLCEKYGGTPANKSGTPEAEGNYCIGVYFSDQYINGEGTYIPSDTPESDIECQTTGTPPNTETTPSYDCLQIGTTTSTPNVPLETDSPSSNIPLAAIVGGVIGLVVVVAVVIALIVGKRKARRKK